MAKWLHFDLDQSTVYRRMIAVDKKKNERTTIAGMNYLWIIRFRIERFALWKRVNRFWLTHDEPNEKEKRRRRRNTRTKEQDQPRATITTEFRYFFFVNNKINKLFVWNGGQNQAIIYKFISMENDYSGYCVCCDGHTVGGGGNDVYNPITNILLNRVHFDVIVRASSMQDAIWMR